MRRLFCLILAVFAAAAAQAIHNDWRYIMSIGPVAPNSDLWTPFRIGEQILVGGYQGGALVCGRYTTAVEVKNVVMRDERGRPYVGQVQQLVTNWSDMFVLTNYPNARFYVIGKGLNSGFEAVRLWDVEVNLPVTSPILDWSRLPPPGTNSAGIPVGWIVQMAPLFDYGLKMPTPQDSTPRTNTPPPPPTGEAEYKLGMRYLNGDGVGKDPAAALDWFVKAHKRGWVAATEQLRTNAHPVFLEWRGSGNASILTPAAPPAQTVPADTNQVESPPPKPPEETPPATNTAPAATPATNADAEIITRLKESNAAQEKLVAQLKESNAATEKRVADLEARLSKSRASETPPQTSSGSARWYWVVGILLAISALWFFSVSRREPE